VSADPPDLPLIGYLNPGWAPLVRPAPSTRAWMDATHQAFAYRCLPLSIANSHGWEVLTPCAFVALWTGGAGKDAIVIKTPQGVDPSLAPTSIFGQGVLTFHVQALFRTPPDWNLWVGGSPNHLKDAIQPLTGVIETDWAPYTFTMNWRFTRPRCWVHFALHEPFCFFFPTPRGVLARVQPEFRPMAEAGRSAEQFARWNDSRTDFNAKLAEQAPAATSQAWQRQYFQGIDMDGKTPVDSHQTKLRLKDFNPI
jgi:hypothetical protein